MILRRITEHVKAQNWFAVFLDFVIVVVGVFIGLQVQSWSNRQDDRAREMQIVADMLADLEIDRAQYGNGMALSLRRVGAATASLEGAGLPPVEFEYETPNTDIVSYTLDIPDGSAVPLSRRKMLWTDVMIGYFPTPSTSTYDAIVGAGDIKIIQDRDLVREIQIYRNLIGGVIVQNDKLITIRTNVLHVGAKYGLAPYVENEPDDYLRLIANEPELAASIRILATFTIFHHGEIESADARAAQLQERLTNYLETAK